MSAKLEESVPVNKQGIKKTRFKKSLETRNFYLFILPFFLLFLLFNAIPIISSLFLGFTVWDGFSAPTFIGLENYIQLFKDQIFLKSIYNTLFIWFFSTILTLGLAFFLAFSINEYMRKAKSFYQMVFLFPLLVAPALTSIIVGILFSSNSGLINAFLSLFADDPVTINWLDSTFWIKPIIVLMIVWRWTGWHMIIFLAGLQTIPKDLYEAARIDGAKGFQIIRSITLPLMAPIILVSLVTATTGGIQLFDEPFVLTNGTGGTLQSGMTMGMYLYNTAFKDFNFGLASAISYVLFGLILIVTLINSKFLNKKE
ncbi:carbohydrate ABC transporter permease (plasmid) [Rossellomorea sp. FS2]|uniref:carbohydrate ABC transporter permease n=1 Tax=Rossellomorea sp. FS2 TaxID=3391447 RepID=UPI003A4D88B9